MPDITYAHPVGLEITVCILLIIAFAIGVGIGRWWQGSKLANEETLRRRYRIAQKYGREQLDVIDEIGAQCEKNKSPFGDLTAGAMWTACNK